MFKMVRITLDLYNNSVNYTFTDLYFGKVVYENLMRKLEEI